jgi:hypothetical protein
MHYAGGMSLPLLNQIDTAYIAYFSMASEAELAEEAIWADFATAQLAAICCNEDAFNEGDL